MEAKQLINKEEIEINFNILISIQFSMFNTSELWNNLSISFNHIKLAYEAAKELFYEEN